MTPQLLAALEGIHFQRDSTLLPQLSLKTAALTSTRDIKERVSILAEMDKIAFKETGMLIKFHMTNERIPNACVLVPSSNSASPMAPEAISRKLSRSAVQSEKEFFNGQVDLTTGRVSGVYSQIPIDVFISSRFFEPTPKGDYFAPEEIASILMHEMGHVLFYFRYLGGMVISNLVIAEISRKVLGNEDPVVVRKAIIAAEIKTGYRLKDLKVIDGKLDPIVIQQIVMAEAVEQIRSDLGSQFYDARAFEFSADQFVSRHGGGIWMARALDRMHRGYGRSVEFYSPRVQFAGFMLSLLEHTGVILQVAMTGIIAGFTWGGVVGAGISVIGLSAYSMYNLVVNVFTVLMTEETSYDDVKGRFDAIRRELISFTKETDLTTAQRKALSEQLDEIAEIVGTTYKDTLGPGFISRFFAGIINGRTAQIKFQQQLEEMGNNRLFELTNKLQSK